MADSGIPPSAAPKPPACPICKRPSTAAARPFCSKRCADVDLHHWFAGSYAVPIDEPASRSGSEDDPV